MVLDAVAFIRTSTKDQKGGILGQRLAIREHAAKEGFTIVAEYVEEGVSGLADWNDRQVLHEALERLSRKPGSVLLVSELSRVARAPLAALQAEKTIRRMGCSVLSAQGEKYGESPSEVFIGRIHQAQREYEALMTSERIKTALRAKKEAKEGKYFSGRPPAGFHVPHPGASLQPHPQEWFEVREWIRRYEVGETQKSIAKLSGKKQPWLSRLFKKHRNVDSFELWTFCECGFVPTKDN